MKAKLAIDNRRRNALLSTFRRAEPRGEVAADEAMEGMLEASQAINSNLAREVVQAGQLWFEVWTCSNLNKVYQAFTSPRIC